MNTGNSIAVAFDAVATIYDAARPRLVPCFDRFYGTAVRLSSHALRNTAEPDITDLGAGTGLLAALVSRSLPQARFTLIDISADMIEQAQKRFSSLDAQAAFIVADYAMSALPQDQDAFVSALSIHHLEDCDKQALFTRIFDALAPGGIFINAEQVAPEPPAVMADALEGWETDVRAAGGSEDELASARERMTHDKCASESAQLEWMRAAGFHNVATAFREGMFCVYSGRKPA